MKRILYLLICFVVLMNLAACSSSINNSIIAAPVYPKSISFEDYDSKKALRENNQVDESYINSLNTFSYNTIQRILKDQSDNICYSPISLQMALTLAGTGANGVTQDEIFSVLGANGKEADHLSIQNSKLFRLLYKDNKIGKMKIANSVWLHKDVDFKDNFITNASNNFYASIYNVDFKDDYTANLMSNWISENTNGIISPKMKLEDEQIMSIINTIYFKDEWIDKFNSENTKIDTFHLKDGSKIICDFMNMTYKTHGYIKGDGFTSSSLNLKNSARMIFILPDRGVSIDDLLSDPQKTEQVFEDKNIDNGKVIFKIPKFSFGNKLNLKDTLMAMGINKAFEEDADFSGITDNIAFISNINQQTHIAIDEKGVEAAAFTKFDYATSAPPNEKVAEMILDRPFLFAIKSSYGAILFAGVVYNPSEAENTNLQDENIELKKEDNDNLVENDDNLEVEEISRIDKLGEKFIDVSEILKKDNNNVVKIRDISLSYTLEENKSRLLGGNSGIDIFNIYIDKEKGSIEFIVENLEFEDINAEIHEDYKLQLQNTLKILLGNKNGEDLYNYFIEYYNKQTDGTYDESVINGMKVIYRCTPKHKMTIYM